MDTGYIIFIIPALLLSMWAQYKINSTFSKYSKIGNIHNYTGSQIAEKLLRDYGINDVKIEPISGNLTDHYDPRDKVLRLSESVYNSTSVAAIGVAAHETGHAVQHDVGYSPLKIRNSIVPVVNIGSQLATPLILLGLIISSTSYALGNTILQFGIILFCGVVIFQLITLPVEFNASNRAIKMLDEKKYLNDKEIKEAKSVLSAAAMTYVAAAVSAIANLLRLIMISNRDKRR